MGLRLPAPWWTWKSPTRSPTTWWDASSVRRAFPEWKSLAGIGFEFPKLTVLWDWDLAKTEELGYTLYMVQSGIDMAIARSKAFLPYADLCWMEQHRPDMFYIYNAARIGEDDTAASIGMRSGAVVDGLLPYRGVKIVTRT